MENIQLKYIQVEILLNEVKDMISNEIGNNPYEDLEKMIKIVSQKNYNHIPAIRNKLKNLSMMLYNRHLDCSEFIFEKLDEVYSLVTESLT
jgi:Na+/phosphate symporter